MKLQQAVNQCCKLAGVVNAQDGLQDSIPDPQQEEEGEGEEGVNALEEKEGKVEQEGNPLANAARPLSSSSLSLPSLPSGPRLTSDPSPPCNHGGSGEQTSFSSEPSEPSSSRPHSSRLSLPPTPPPAVSPPPHPSSGPAAGGDTPHSSTESRLYYPPFPRPHSSLPPQGGAEVSRTRSGSFAVLGTLAEESPLCCSSSELSSAAEWNRTAAADSRRRKSESDSNAAVTVAYVDRKLLGGSGSACGLLQRLPSLEGKIRELLQGEKFRRIFDVSMVSGSH